MLTFDVEYNEPLQLATDVEATPIPIDDTHTLQKSFVNVNFFYTGQYYSVVYIRLHIYLQEALWYFRRKTLRML